MSVSETVGTLHSTMFLLIRKGKVSGISGNVDTLHSTMFLLIRDVEPQIVRRWTHFTFHNVSINTAATEIYFDGDPALHSTMFLLIRFHRSAESGTGLSLHSTMFLLIREPSS